MGAADDDDVEIAKWDSKTHARKFQYNMTLVGNSLGRFGGRFLSAKHIYQGRVYTPQGLWHFLRAWPRIFAFSAYSVIIYTSWYSVTYLYPKPRGAKRRGAHGICRICHCLKRHWYLHICIESLNVIFALWYNFELKLSVHTGCFKEGDSWINYPKVRRSWV